MKKLAAKLWAVLMLMLVSMQTMAKTRLLAIVLTSERKYLFHDHHPFLRWRSK